MVDYQEYYGFFIFKDFHGGILSHFVTILTFYYETDCMLKIDIFLREKTYQWTLTIY